MNLSLLGLLLLFFVSSVVIILLSSTSSSFLFVVEANNNNDAGVVKGRWAITVTNPSLASTVKDVLLTEFTQVAGTTRVMARFVADDASSSSSSSPGNFLQDTIESFSSASSCSSSPDPDFWQRYGEKLLVPKASTVDGNQVSITLRRLRATDGSVVLPGGRAQTITCGPLMRKGGSDAEKPKVTTRGLKIDPPSFSFVIEPSPDSQLVFLRHTDYMPYATIAYPKSTSNTHQKRADFDHIEIFGNQVLGVNSMDFYVAARGNEFLIDTEEQQRKLKEEIAHKFICTPAPCHLALRNRTFNFIDVKEAEAFAKKNGYYDSVDVKTDNDKKGLRSWLTGVSEDERADFNNVDKPDPHVIRPEDVTIVNSALVRIKIHSAELFRRGFDLPPLDNLDTLAKNAMSPSHGNSNNHNARRGNQFLARSRGVNGPDLNAGPPPLPDKPSIYKLQLRHLDRAVLRNPETISYDHPLERAPFLSLEAPYAPAQRLRLTYVDQEQGSYPLEAKAGGALVLTDRCIASGFDFHADEHVRSKVMPAFVHRCPPSLIIHGDMLPGLHPYGVKIENMLSVERCRGQKLQCKQTFFEEYPPHYSNASMGSRWALNRLVEDVKGFVISNNADENQEDNINNQEGQNLLFPNLQDNLVVGGAGSEIKKPSIDLATAKFAYPLASSPVMGQLLHNDAAVEDWIDDFDFFSKGALRITFRPVPNFRVKQATVLSVALHPGMLRNGRPSDATENPMTLVVVPSHGILTPHLLNKVVRKSDEASSSSSSSSSNKIELNVVWKLDEYDEFSQELISQLNENLVGKELVNTDENNLPITWTAFVPSSSSSSSSCVSEWRVKPGVAESVILVSAATEKEIKLKLTFALPPPASSTACNPDNDEIELNAPGIDAAKWIQSGKMPLVEVAKFKIL